MENKRAAFAGDVYRAIEKGAGNCYDSTGVTQKYIEIHCFCCLSLILKRKRKQSKVDTGELTVLLLLKM